MWRHLPNPLGGSAGRGRVEHPRSPLVCVLLRLNRGGSTGVGGAADPKSGPFSQCPLESTLAILEVYCTIYCQTEVPARRYERPIWTWYDWPSVRLLKLARGPWAVMLDAGLISGISESPSPRRAQVNAFRVGHRATRADVARWENLSRQSTTLILPCTFRGQSPGQAQRQRLSGAEGLLPS